MTTDPHNEYNNENLKCENYQNVTQRHEVSNVVGEMVPVDLLDEGLPQTFSL